MIKMSKVMMVVISYNDKIKTLKTIDALKQQSYPVNIIVWDNNSKDGTQDALNEIEGITVINSKDNLMWTPAINEVIKNYYKDEKFIGFMNNDIFLRSDCIEKLVETASRDNIGIVAPIGSNLGGCQNYNNHIFGRSNIDPERRVAYVVGACCLLRKEVWDQVGELDSKMPLGADDHDYCMRLKHEGYQIFVRQDTYAEHVGHASNDTPEGKKNWNDWGVASWDIFNNKWAGYYSTEEQAINCHWGSAYVPGFDVGTGWDDKTYISRIKLEEY